MEELLLATRKACSHANKRRDASEQRRAADGRTAQLTVGLACAFIEPDTINTAISSRHASFCELLSLIRAHRDRSR